MSVPLIFNHLYKGDIDAASTQSLVGKKCLNRYNVAKVGRKWFDGPTTLANHRNEFNDF